MPKKRKKGRSRGGGGDYPDSWNPGKGEKLVGKVTRHEDGVETKFGETDVLEVKDKDGDKYTVWCGNKSLGILFDETEKGDKVSIKFISKDRGKFGRRHYEIKVNGEELDLDDEDEDEEDDEEDDDEEEDDD